MPWNTEPSEYQVEAKMNFAKIRKLTIITLITFMMAYCTIKEAKAEEVKRFNINVEAVCGPDKVIEETLFGKHSEKVIFGGSTDIKIKGKKPIVFLLANIEKGTFSYVLYLNEDRIACLIDSGQILKSKQKENTIAL